MIDRVAVSPLRDILLLTRVLMWRLASVLVPGASRFIRLDELATYRNSDIIIDLGGDNLSIPLSANSVGFRLKRNVLSLVGHSYVFFLCFLLKKPVVIYAQTIGPLGVMRAWMRVLLNKMSLITVREENSLHYLAQIGVSIPPIHLTADPAFLLPASSGNEIENEGIRTELPIVGMCLSSETAKFHYKNGELEFKRLFASVIDSLLSKYQAYVVLIPFSTWKGHGGDDRIIAREIRQLVKERQRVGVLVRKYDPMELKGIISKCCIFIGSRGHSCIFALSSYVPTIAIGHNPKYDGIMKMLGQERFVLRTIDLTREDVIRLFDSLWISQSDVKQMLKRKMQSMRRLAALNAELVRNLLSSAPTQDSVTN